MVVHGYLVYGNNSLSFERKVTVIGRAPSCHIVFAHPSISKEHAQIKFQDDGKVLLLDLGSLNGITVNGKPIPKNASVYLKQGDRITLAKDPNNYYFRLDSIHQMPMRVMYESQSEPHLRQIDKPVNLVEHDSLTKNRVSKIRTPSPPRTLGGTGKLFITESQLEKAENPFMRGSDVYSNPVNISRNEDEIENPKMDPRNGSQGGGNYGDGELVTLSNQLFDKDKQIGNLQFEYEMTKKQVITLQEELGRNSAKLNAVEIYCTELQRKNDLLERQIKEKNFAIEEIQEQDIIKRAQDSELELKHLRQILVHKENEIFLLKEQVEQTLKAAAGSQHITYHQHFFEQQTRDLVLARKQLEEYENRNLECKKQWTDLIKENIKLEERIKGLTVQIDRQAKENADLKHGYEKQLNVYDRKVAQLVSLDTSSRERKAAETLLLELNDQREEKLKVMSQMEQMNQQMQYFVYEIKALNFELENYRRYFTPIDPLAVADGVPHPPDVSKLKARNDELNDLIHEMRQTVNEESVNRIVELKTLVADLEARIHYQEATIEKMKDQINNWMVQSGMPPDQKEMIDFFARALDEREDRIRNLQRENKALSEHGVRLELDLEELRMRLGMTASQLGELQVKQSQVQSILTTKRETGSPTANYHRPYGRDGFPKKKDVGT